MTDEIRIYVEGGGDRKDTKANLRRGLGAFLRELRDEARARRIRWQVVASGGRASALDDFQTACRTHPAAFNVLLVDSEGPVSDPPRQHLQKQDGWTTALSEEHCQLMVQTMEAWLVADVDALAGFYGDEFRRNAIPQRADVEEIDKDSLRPALVAATRHTQKGPYHKTRHGFKLLGLIEPVTVRSKAKHCKRLFETLTKVMGENPGQATFRQD